MASSTTTISYHQVESIKNSYCSSVLPFKGPGFPNNLKPVSGLFFRALVIVRFIHDPTGLELVALGLEVLTHKVKALKGPNLTVKLCVIEPIIE